MEYHYNFPHSHPLPGSKPWESNDVLLLYVFPHIPSGNLTWLLKMAIYSGFSHKKIVIFHSYVSLPEGTLNIHNPFNIQS